MFSDCTGPCTTCSVSGVGCLAGHGDDHYSPISKEEAISRLEHGRRPMNRRTRKPGRIYTPDELTELRRHAGLDPAPEQGHSIGEWPQCCSEAEGHIRWREHRWEWGIDARRGVAILFCPWCGERLT